MGYEKVVVSAPTYIKFSSTHGSATGEPALFAAINKRTVVRLAASKKREVIPSTFARQTHSIIKFLTPKIPVDMTFSLAVSGTYPKVLGSQISLVVATIGAVIYFTRKLWNPHEINTLAYEYLKSKRPTSGGEVTAATFGGFIWERRELSFLNSIWQLPIRLIPKLDHFYLLRSKPSRYKLFPRSFDRLRMGLRVSLSRTLSVVEPKRESKKILDQVEDDKGNYEEVIKQLAEALKKGDDSWLRQNLQAISVGEKLYVCYDFDTSKHTGITFEKIHLGEEGIRIENKKLSFSPKGKGRGGEEGL